MQYWLFKSEPDVFSFEDLKKKGKEGTPWDGVRNFAARNAMRAMQIGDYGFFYHSNLKREIVGVVQVIALAHREAGTEDPRWECVDICAVCDLPQKVSLSFVKQTPSLKTMILAKNSRLSVQPVMQAEWKEICTIAKLTLEVESKINL